MDSCCYAMTARWANTPEQFLGNGLVNTFPRQQIRKQQSRYCWAITMETVFSMWLVPKHYKQSQSGRGRIPPPVALQVALGEEKGTQCLGV
jgi:hypothetical protein